MTKIISALVIALSVAFVLESATASVPRSGRIRASPLKQFTEEDLKNGRVFSVAKSSSPIVEVKSEGNRDIESHRSKRSLFASARGFAKECQYCQGHSKKRCQRICGAKGYRHFWCGPCNCFCHGGPGLRNPK